MEGGKATGTGALPHPPPARYNLEHGPTGNPMTETLTQATTTTTPAGRSAWLLAGAAIAVLAATMYMLRLAGPSDLAVGAQDRTAGYVLDVLQNRRWLAPFDATGGVMTKPPLHVWFSAGIGHALGQFNRFSLTLPSAIMTLLTAWLVWRLTARYLGEPAGFFAAVAYLLSLLTAKQIALVRPDATLAMMTTAAAFLAVEAWHRGRGWTLFWLAAALATLAKHPLGMVLPLAGLLAVLWERWGPAPLPLRGRMWPGMLLFVLLVGGWFLLAWLQVGQPLIDMLFKKELVGHAIADGKGRRFGHGFYKPLGYFLWYFGPWSIFCIIGLCRVLWRPAADDRARRFERFIFCMLVAGLAIFSLGGHQRPDHLMVLIPAAAMLAGRELVMLRESLAPRVLWPVRVGLIAGSFTLLACYYHLVRPGENDAVETAVVQHAAEQLSREKHFRIVHVDSVPALRIFLRQTDANVDARQAAELLAQDAPVVVTVRHPGVLLLTVDESVQLFEWARWPFQGGSLDFSVVSNRPASADWPDSRPLQ
jgi:4-amino-4-deoxy-L-arabinose transferase-like glycosyltransferase